MDQFWNFVVNHWQLWAILVALLIALVIVETQVALGGAKALSPHQVIAMINNEQALIVDLRNKEQYQRGHIIDAKQIDEKDLQAKFEKLAQSKSKPFVLSCDTGQQAQKLANNLLKAGYQHVGFLSGGIKAWREANLPLIKN